MTDVSVLDVFLSGQSVGSLTHIHGDRTLFSFRQDYIDNPDRPVLSLSFKDSFGDLITDLRPYQTRLSPFFANMLPEGTMRDYLAARSGINPKREFFLLKALGQDLPGAVTVAPAAEQGRAAGPVATGEETAEADAYHGNVLRFSLAGVQLKLSAVKKPQGGLTIPAHGVGGAWIVKLPSSHFKNVPENEYAMMKLAGKLGMNVPELQLIDVGAIANLPEGISYFEDQKALAVKRFDRTEEGRLIHIEDFAQIFSVYPEEKYETASCRNIATVLGIETGETDIAEFIRRLVFNTLIGNADMHLKNWSLIYPDGRQAALAPAYDFVATVAYIKDETAALKYGRTKRMAAFSMDELRYIADKARLSETLVTETARRTVETFLDIWPTEKKTFDPDNVVTDAIDSHLKTLRIIREN